MNDKAKLGLSIAAIILCGGFIVSFVFSSGTSADFPDGGTWAKCSACGEMQVKPRGPADGLPQVQ